MTEGGGSRRPATSRAGVVRALCNFRAVMSLTVTAALLVYALFFLLRSPSVKKPVGFAAPHSISRGESTSDNCPPCPPRVCVCAEELTAEADRLREQERLRAEQELQQLVEEQKGKYQVRLGACG
jgi:hypothetical protein